MPIEQQRFLTQEELIALKRRRIQEDKTIDLTKYQPRKKMTAEEMRKHSKDSKDPENSHKSNYWNRKDNLKCSRTNKEKRGDKAMSMTLHSTVVRKRAARSAREKEAVRRKHAYNMGRGISKKAKL